MSRFYVTTVAVLAFLCAGTAIADQTLSLEEAIQKTLQKHPRLQVVAAKERAASAQLTQAKTWANPELSFIAEDFSGDTGVGVQKGSQSWQLSQPVVLPSKRSARKQFAAVGVEIATLAIQQERAALVRMVREMSVDMVAADQRYQHALQSLLLAQKLREGVAAKVEAGKVSPVELARAEVSLAAAYRAERMAMRRSELAQAALKKLWGEQGGEKLTIPMVLELPATLPEVPTIEHVLLLKQRQLEVSQREDRVREVAQDALPDITVTVGMKRSALTRDESLMIGASLPLPIFNRNQGERSMAVAERDAALADFAAEKLQIEQEISRLEMERESSFQEVQRLHDLLKISEKTAGDLQEGYAAGKFSLMDLLDGQRSLVEIQEEDIAMHIVYQKSDAALNELMEHEVHNGLGEKQ
jgi:cobalt-zinc-cadmium efflux system outer membrane protein